MNPTDLPAAVRQGFLHVHTDPDGISHIHRCTTDDFNMDTVVDGIPRCGSNPRPTTPSAAPSGFCRRDGAAAGT
ncbi:hypothetical protein [Actinoplanes aureus]|uniref:Uncharacterized protein n=1 Tax=Actinoplanes aureus TaxID=2792083 RepID=A0A931CJE8_9ACTN|nr:hypothetical protein [Actinoplanes aureus]MBG0568448.1 hypothetical protein [Actinoplanes aureus]